MVILQEQELLLADAQLRAPLCHGIGMPGGHDQQSAVIRLQLLRQQHRLPQKAAPAAEAVNKGRDPFQRQPLLDQLRCTAADTPHINPHKSVLRQKSCLHYSKDAQKFKTEDRFSLHIRHGTV